MIGVFFCARVHCVSSATTTTFQLSKTLGANTCCIPWRRRSYKTRKREDWSPNSSQLHVSCCIDGWHWKYFWGNLGEIALQPNDTNNQKVEPVTKITKTARQMTQANILWGRLKHPLLDSNWPNNGVALRNCTEPNFPNLDFVSFLGLAWVWRSTCPRRHHEQHILMCCGHMPVQWNVCNLLHALPKTLLPYATTLSAARKCKMWRRKSHIPPRLVSITHPAAVLRLLCRLLRSAHLNHTVPLRHALTTLCFWHVH